MENNISPKFSGLLALSQKAGKLQSGEARATDAIRCGKAFLVILSKDASKNTEKRFSDMASFRKLPIIKIGDRQTLGHIIGKEFAVVIAVEDEGFAHSLIKAV